MQNYSKQGTRYSYVGEVEENDTTYRYEFGHIILPASFTSPSEMVSEWERFFINGKDVSWKSLPAGMLERLTENAKECEVTNDPNRFDP